MKLDIRELREGLTDVREQIGGLRDEMQKGFGSLRQEMYQELAKLRQEIIRGLASNRIWMLLQSAAILAVMAGVQVGVAPARSRSLANHRAPACAFATMRR